MISSASVSFFLSRTQRAEQSKLTSPHWKKLIFRSSKDVRGLTHLVEIDADGVNTGVDILEVKYTAKLWAR